ncbi:transmembrane protein 246-like, partial [Argonauta hians]
YLDVFFNRTHLHELDSLFAVYVLASRKSMGLGEKLRQFNVLLKYMAGKCLPNIIRLPNLGRQARIHFVVLYSSTFLILLPVLCHKLPFSVYYMTGYTDTADGISKFNAENDKRLNFANGFLKTVFTKMEHLPNSPWVTSDFIPEVTYSPFENLKSKVDIAITIISVSRNRHKFDSYEPRYLTQVVGQYLQLFQNSESHRKNIKLSLCNVDSQPESYHEIHDLSSFIPTFQRYPDSSAATKNIFEKEKQDYVYCLNASLTWKPSYVLLVEDDSLPYNDMLHVLYNTIDYINDIDNHHGSYQHFPDQWYLKLYHPDRLLGYWSLEVERIPELISLTLVFGLSLLLFYRYIELKSIFININVSWFLLSLYFLLLFIAIGRQNLLEVRRLSKHFYMLTPSPSCCTPAILYTNTTAKAVIKYLSDVHCKKHFAKDMALEQMRSVTNMKAYLLQPNLFKHIGLYSSLRSKVLNPSIV